MTQLINYLKQPIANFLWLGLLCLWACGSADNTGTQQTDSIVEVDSGNNPDLVSSPSASSQKRSPGSIPLDFPLVNTTAKANEYVLAPMLQWVEDGFIKGKDQMVLIFYGRKMVAPGKVESKLKAIGKEVMMPNSMIIPVPVGEKVLKGEVVLTWEQNRGSSMRTAIVTDASNPASPKIQYLDTPYTPGVSDVQAQPNTFVALRKPWQPGVYLAVKEDFGYNYAQIIREADNKVLTIGFTGKVKVYNKNNCVPVPFKPQLKPGDKVHVVKIAAFIEGVVKKVLPEIGRVMVEIDFGGKPETVVAGYGKIIKDLKIR
ncbi:hypothetical protein [Microscilla marina]|uniref:Lipoprotein n=1 Tax=Microscilla marina ATCC 23134 TaxID=313606 RepID=A1ZJP4_MICM2|nr:hypothetical protein [Microscilla marina]EAY29347.1 hypothetical protein M23134_01403 [Microscilla marina ATCC 23134]